MGLALIFVSGAGSPDPARGGKYNASKYFPSLSTVTIILYDQQATGSSAISLTTDACPEIGTTGMYVWSFANITTLPSPYKEYVYVMTDGATSQGGIVAYDEFLIQYIIHENMEI